MASTGFKTAGTGASVNTGSAAWSNPGNITADDNSYATVAEESAVSSDTLRATNFDFSSVPDLATIDGYQLRYNRHALATLAITTTHWRPVLSGVSQGTDQTAGGDWEGSETETTVGGASDLMGATPTAANIKDSGWGWDIFVDWATGIPGMEFAYVDVVSANVFYTTASFHELAHRFRADDGGETAATWLAAQDADLNYARDKNLRIRFETEEQAGADANQGAVLQFRHKPLGGAFGAWTDTGAGLAVVMSLSDHFADNDDCTQQIGTSLNVFDADNDGMQEVNGLDIYKGPYNLRSWEHEWCFQINSSVVAVGAEIQLRERGGGVYDSYATTPTITVTAGNSGLLMTMGCGG